MRMFVCALCVCVCVCVCVCACMCMNVSVCKGMAEEGEISLVRQRWHTWPVKRVLHLTVQLLPGLRWVVLGLASRKALSQSQGEEIHRVSTLKEMWPWFKLIDQRLNSQITPQWLFVNRIWFTLSMKCRRICPERRNQTSTPTPKESLGFLHIPTVTDSRG